MKLFEIFDQGLKDIKENGPLVFAGVACVGVIATGVVSVWAGKKLKEKEPIIKKKVAAKEKEKGAPLTKRESLVIKVKEKWPQIAAVIITEAITISCLIVSVRGFMKKIVTLTATVTALTTSFEEYKAAAKKVLGEKEHEIEKERLKAKMAENPMTPEEAAELKKKQQEAYDAGIYPPGVLMHWREVNTGNHFNMLPADLEKAIKEVDFELRDGYDQTLRDLLYAISHYTKSKIEYPPIVDYIVFPAERYRRGLQYDLSKVIMNDQGVAEGIIRYKACTGETQTESLGTWDYY